MGAAGEDDLQVPAEGLCRYQLFGNQRTGGGKPFIDGFQHQRHHEHHVRLEQPHVLHHMQKGIVDAYGGPQGKSLEPVHDEAEGVVDRKHAEHHGSGLPGIIHGCHVGCQVILGQHDALALSGGPGCEDDGGRIPGSGPVRVGVHAFGELHQGQQRRGPGIRHILLLFLQNPYFFQLRTSGCNRVQKGSVLRAQEKPFGIRAVDQVD